MMNTRIKELAKQAGFAMKIDDDPNSPPGWWGAGHDPTFEKFAELIVRECADIAKTAAPYSSDDLILKRFGFDNE
jgi:hypothetical protein